MHSSIRVAALAALAAGAASATPPDTLVMAYNIDAISTFDPAQIGEVVTNEIILNTCDSLVRHDMEEESGVLPAVAESWSVSDDGMSVTFDLVQDATFPSGNPVTAQDVAWSMQRVLKLGFGNSATLTEYGFTAETAEQQFVAVDDHTFRMNLSRPYPVGLLMQAVAANRVANVLDRETVMAEAVEGDLGNQFLTTNTACVGPYRLARWNAGEVVILERNDDYYGEAPAMARWLIRHVPEAGAQRLLLEQGDVDVARDLGSEDVRAMVDNPELALISRKKHQMYYLGFDNAQARFADDRVRRAFGYLFDLDALAETVMTFDGVPRNSVVPAGAFGALDDAAARPYALDIEKARALLEEAGLGDGFEARLFIGTLPYAAPIAQHLQANAAKVGVTLNIEQMANAQLFSAFRGREFDMVMLSWSTSVPHAQGMLQRHAVNPDNSAEAKLTMFPTWRASWYRPEFNKRVDEALFTREPEAQAELYRKIALDHIEQGPFVYLFQTLDSGVARAEVDDWTWNAFRVDYTTVTKAE